MTEHDKLQDSLAMAKGTIYQNVNLGSKLGDPTIPRADIVRVSPTYIEYNVEIYEVKQARADFLSDIRTEKWKKYLPYCSRFYFAVLKGMASKTEMPKEAGLYVYNPEKKSWTCTKAAPKRLINGDPVFIEMLLSLTMYRQKNEKRRYNLSRDSLTVGLHLGNLGKEIESAMVHKKICPALRYAGCESCKFNGNWGSEMCRNIKCNSYLERKTR